MEAILAMVWAGMEEPLMVMVGRRGPRSEIGGQRKKRRLSQKVVFRIDGLSCHELKLRWNHDVVNLVTQTYL